MNAEVVPVGTRERVTLLEQQVEQLRAHLSEQVTFVQSRLDYAKDLGSSVWRLALEDVIRENRAVLNELSGPLLQSTTLEKTP